MKTPLAIVLLLLACAGLSILYTLDDPPPAGGPAPEDPATEIPVPEAPAPEAGKGPPDERPTGRLVVRSMTWEGSAIPDAAVEVRWEDGTSVKGRTGPDGELRLGEVPTGRIVTTASADGWFPDRRQYDRVPFGGLAIVPAHLRPARTLSGRVVSAEDGSPVAGAAVSAVTMSGDYMIKEPRRYTDAPAGETVADADGRFTLPCVPEEPSSGLLIGVRAEGFRTTRRLFEKLPAPGGEVSIPLASGGAIFGRIKAPGGGGLEGVRVIAVPMDHEGLVRPDAVIFCGEVAGAKEAVFPVETRSVDSGYFIIRGLGPGEAYAFRFEMEGFAVRTERNVTFSSPRGSTHLVPTLEPGGALRVTVKGTSGDTVEGATATVWDPRTKTLVEAVSGPDGVARISPVAPGSQTVRARAPGGPEAMVRYEMPAAGDGACEVAVIVGVPGGPPPEARAPGEHSLTGTMVHSDGTPVAHGSVRIPSLHRRTDLERDGTFRFDRVPEGKHRLALQPLTAQFTDVTAVVPGPPVRAVLHRNPEVRKETGADAAPPPGRAILLRVVDEADAPVPTATATTWPSYAGPRIPAGTDGRIRVTGIAEGGAVLWVEAPGFVTKKIRIAAGTGDATAVLDRGVLFRIVVRDGNGDPVSRADVSIKRDAETRDDRFRDSRRTPTTGEVAFRAPEGDYELKVGPVVRRVTVDAARAGEPVVVVLP